MKWNWQLPDWPSFSYNAEALRAREATFLQNAGQFYGAFKHLDQASHEQLKIECLSDEAFKTSEIEGEHLDRESLQSSIRKQFGLQVESKRKIPGAERGVAEMMVDVYTNFDATLSKERLFRWHQSLLNARKDLTEIDAYRSDAGLMQIISGAVHAPTVHFEAPPARRVTSEMKRFFNWYARSQQSLGPLIRAGIAHVYFLAIHPFSDGNGRIARALSEKALAEAIGQPTLIALAQTIEQNKKAYYAALQSTNQSLDLNAWLNYFASTVIQAQQNSLQRVEWLIHKAKVFNQHSNQLNPRQSKVLLRLFDAGSDGFVGGLSAENYIRLTQTSRATATRDLQDLVAKQVLYRTGELKHTRYWIETTRRR